MQSAVARSEEHTSELQSLMRISYDVFCLKKKTTTLHSTLFKLFSYYFNPTGTAKFYNPTHNNYLESTNKVIRSMNVQYITRLRQNTNYYFSSLTQQNKVRNNEMKR